MRKVAHETIGRRNRLQRYAINGTAMVNGEWSKDVKS